MLKQFYIIGFVRVIVRAPGVPVHPPKGRLAQPSSRMKARAACTSSRVGVQFLRKSGGSSSRGSRFLLGAVVKLGVQLDVRRRSWALTGLQEQRLTRAVIKIEAVNQIIGVLVALGQRVKVKALLDEFQH
jgi:hypothetical protein